MRNKGLAQLGHILRPQRTKASIDRAFKLFLAELGNAEARVGRELYAVGTTNQYGSYEIAIMEEAAMKSCHISSPTNIKTCKMCRRCSLVIGFDAKQWLGECSITARFRNEHNNTHCEHWTDQP